MILARIDGFLTASVAHPSMRGQKVVLCTPIDETGKTAGSPFAALDPIGSGRHSKVFISTDGSFTQKRLNDFKSPLRNEIIAIVDDE